MLYMHNGLTILMSNPWVNKEVTGNATFYSLVLKQYVYKPYSTVTLPQQACIQSKLKDRGAVLLASTSLLAQIQVTIIYANSIPATLIS